MYMPRVVTPPASELQDHASEPALLIETKRWHRIFIENLNDLLWPQHYPSLHLSSAPGEFWPDVFVASKLPWRRVPVSGALHVVIVGIVLLIGWLMPRSTQISTRATFNSNEVISFSPSEYLPPLDTGGQHAQPARHGDPAHATQPILSVPPESDNQTQTIATPSNVKLKQDVPMPNVVAWKQTPPSVPIAATENIESRRAPVLPSAAIAPAPEVMQLATRHTNLLQPTAVAPQPQLQANLSRRLDKINIGHQQVVAPTPQLPVPESHTPFRMAGPDAVKVAAPQPVVNLTQHQRRVALPQDAAVAPAPEIQTSHSSSLSSRRFANNLAGEEVVAPAPNVGHLDRHARTSITLNKTDAVPPAPSAQGLITKTSERQLIALNLHPSVTVAAPQGNRRGTFAANPQGKQDAAGTPDGVSGALSNAVSKSITNELPPGLHVGTPEKSQPKTADQAGGTGSGTDDHALMASVTPPRVSGRRAKEVPEESASEDDRRIFGGRKFYSMAMNFANLNSAGGSWILHFAELNNSEKGDLMAPEVEHQVDPAYPTDLMRQNVHGTVVLEAVVGTNGSVSDIKVIERVDDRLDEYARQALSKWQFRPATKNGKAVPLTMVVKVPFRPARDLF
jgi:TonB family protein